jgi:hypothetical protein
MNRKQQITKRYRKVSWGRLFWRNPHNSRMQHMDSDDVCIIRDGALTAHYKTLAAFLEDLEEWERLTAPTT